MPATFKKKANTPYSPPPSAVTVASPSPVSPLSDPSSVRPLLFVDRFSNPLNFSFVVLGLVLVSDSGCLRAEMWISGRRFIGVEEGCESPDARGPGQRETRQVVGDRWEAL